MKAGTLEIELITNVARLQKETGIEIAPDAPIFLKMADLQGFILIFGQFQSTALPPDDHSKFREIVRLPKRVCEPEKRVIRIKWRKSAIS